MNAGFGRLHWIALIMNRRGRACEIIDFVDLNVERECDVVPRQFEMLVIEQLLNILASAGEKVIGAENVPAIRKKPFAKMRAKESCAPGHQNPLLQMHEIPDLFSATSIKSAE